MQHEHPFLVRKEFLDWYSNPTEATAIRLIDRAARDVARSNPYHPRASVRARFYEDRAIQAGSPYNIDVQLVVLENDMRKLVWAVKGTDQWYHEFEPDTLKKLEVSAMQPWHAKLRENAGYTTFWQQNIQTLGLQDQEEGRSLRQQMREMNRLIDEDIKYKKYSNLQGDDALHYYANQAAINIFNKDGAL